MFARFLSSVLKAPGMVGTAVLFLFLLGLATFYAGIKTDLFPPLNFPSLVLITEIPSYSSLEMERQVTTPIENAVSGVLGVNKVRSTSATGISLVMVDFKWGSNILTARQLIQEALANARSQLPEGSQTSIENLATTLSLIEGYSLLGGSDPIALRDMAVYDLKPRLQRVPGVYKVTVMGGQIMEYAVRPNPYLMIKYGITLEDIKDALSKNNIQANPGVVDRYSQELAVRSNSQFEDATEIANVEVAIKNGIPITVGDVAKVSKGYEYTRGDTSENGVPNVVINIFKQPNFDTGEVADGVALEIKKFREGLPKGFSIGNYYDQAQLVRNSIGSVLESVWIGAFLVVLVIAWFLRHWKATLVAALSIPLSVVAAIVLMRVFDIGLNIMSLGGLAIGTGIIVDDTIVVLENIFRWLSTPALRGQKSAAEAILKATEEVVRPVTVSTLTNIGIFLPMVFVEGLAGRLFAPVSLTVTFALLASLAVALTIVPLLILRVLAAEVAHGRPESKFFLKRVYEAALGVCLQHPRRVLLLAFLPVALALFGLRYLNLGFLPVLDEGTVLMITRMPAGTSLKETRKLNVKIEDWIKKLPGVVTVVRRAGHAPGAEDTDNVNHCEFMIKLLPKNERPMSEAAFIDLLRAKTSSLPVQAEYLMPLADKINDSLGGVPADLGVDLFGPDLGQLRRYSDLLVGKMKNVRGLVDLKPPEDVSVPSLVVTADKKMAGKLGINEESIHDTLLAYTTGLPITRVRLTQKEINVTAHFGEQEQDFDFEALGDLPLRTTAGNTIPLDQVADLHFGSVPGEINHEYSARKLTIEAGMSGRNHKDIAKDVEKCIGEIHLPPDYSWNFSGKYQAERSALRNMAVVFLLAIFVVGFILWLEFRSFLEVGLILLTIPLASVGAVLSLWIFNETVNVSSMIGAILLVGIVVRNGIILLDYINRQLREGKPLEAAIHIAALKRVRPILMTASVMVLGLLPLATDWGTGSELLHPLAIAVIGGIFTSTVLTLVVLPSAVRLMAAFIHKK